MIPKIVIYRNKRKTSRRGRREEGGGKDLCIHIWIYFLTKELNQLFWRDDRVGWQ
jgi:hypothetical protein